jgi:hypothetical protein
MMLSRPHNQGVSSFASIIDAAASFTAGLAAAYAAPLSIRKLTTA